ncbi:MAG: nicotinamide riboside transporter PnuC [Actinomycetota bacterium]
MSALRWLFEAQVVVAGHPILWREVIGNVFGLASAVGGMRRRVWAWPVGIAGNVLLFTVFLGAVFDNPEHATLLGQAGRQVMFVLVSVYGWVRWSRSRSAGAGPAVQPRWATGRERAVLVGAGLLAVAVLTPVFRALGSYDPVWADAWIFVGSVMATYAMARGWVEFWLCWIAVDLVGVPLLLRAQFYPSAALYAVYGAFVIWGFTVWLRVARTTTLTEPAMETVA